MLIYIVMQLSEADIKIIQDCIDGDEAAWNSFSRRFSGLVRWSARQWLKRYGYSFTENDLDEIHQEVFLHLYRGNRLGQLKDINKAAGWLSIISGHIAHNYMSRIPKVQRQSVPLDENLPSLSDISIEQIDKKLLKEAIDKAAETLSVKEKLVFKLHFECENTINEIADNLGLPQGTIASIISRSKDKIKNFLKK